MSTSDKIALRLEKLISEVARLRSHGKVTFEFLHDNPNIADAIERQLEVACEIVLDIARIIISSDRKLGIGKDYKEFILLLKPAGVLTEEFAEQFSKIAGFRNILVYGYLDIDPYEILDKVNNRLGDFDTFIKSVAQFYDLKTTP